jgi:hypothetical protein
MIFMGQIQHDVNAATERYIACDIKVAACASTGGQMEFISN